MGRKKKETIVAFEGSEQGFEPIYSKEEETNAGVNFWEETEKMEAVEVEEVQEAEENTEEVEEQPTEETNEVKCPNVNCNFHLPFEEGAKCVNCGFTFTKKNMEEFEEKDLHEEANEDFMEEIEEKPIKLTPAQRLKKIADLEDDISKAKTRMSEIETIAELADTTGFRTMVEEVKTQVHSKIDDEDIKTSKDGLKVLEAVLLTEKTVNGFKFQYNDKKSSVKEWESKIVELKAGQLTIFDGGKTDEETVAENNELASTTEPEAVPAA